MDDNERHGRAEDTKGNRLGHFEVYFDGIEVYALYYCSERMYREAYIKGYSFDMSVSAPLTYESLAKSYLIE
jgi:hypothetical protein